MLSKAPPVPQLPPPSNNVPTTDAAGEVPQAIPAGEVPQANPEPNAVAPRENPPNPEIEQGPEEDVHEVRVNAAAGPLVVSITAAVRVLRRQAAQAGEQPQAVAGRGQQQKPKSDRLLSAAAVGLAVAIAFLLVKKYLKSRGLPSFMDGM